jgi:hypothetical protein
MTLRLFAYLFFSSIAFICQAQDNDLFPYRTVYYRNNSINEIQGNIGDAVMTEIGIEVEISFFQKEEGFMDHSDGTKYKDYFYKIRVTNHSEYIYNLSIGQTWIIDEKGRPFERHCDDHLNKSSLLYAVDIYPNQIIEDICQCSDYGFSQQHPSEVKPSTFSTSLSYYNYSLINYNDWIKAGDQLFELGDSKNLFDAKYAYNMALTFVYDQYPVDMINEIEKIIGEEVYDIKDCKKLIEEADTHYYLSEYENALEKYEYASRIGCNDEYVIQMIKEVKDIINQDNSLTTDSLNSIDNTSHCNCKENEIKIEKPLIEYNPNKNNSEVIYVCECIPKEEFNRLQKASEDIVYCSDEVTQIIERLGNLIINATQDIYSENFNYASFLNKFNKINDEISSLNCSFTEKQLAKFEDIISQMKEKIISQLDHLNIDDMERNSAFPVMRIPSSIVAPQLGKKVVPSKSNSNLSGGKVEKLPQGYKRGANNDPRR